MDVTDAFSFILSSVLYKLPIFIVLIGGIVYALVNASKNQSANRKVLGGLIILTTVEVLSSFIPLAQYYYFNKSGSSSTTAFFSFIVAFISSIVFAVGLGLVLSAIWTNKNADY